MVDDTSSLHHQIDQVGLRGKWWGRESGGSKKGKWTGEGEVGAGREKVLI